VTYTPRPIRYTGARAADRDFEGSIAVSIVRIGLAETRNFAEGYEAIFGKNKAASVKTSKPAAARAAKSRTAKKKKAAKKK